MDMTLDDESPRARLALLLKHFSELDDDREAWRILYPIKEVLVLVVCATIASCDDFDDIVEWGEKPRRKSRCCSPHSMISMTSSNGVSNISTSFGVSPSS